MATQTPDSAENLRGEILAEARRQSEEILCRAKEQAGSLLAAATAEADKARHERLEQARAEASRRAELILATVPVEANRLHSARVEALLQSVCEEVRRRLAAGDGFDNRDAIIALAAEAVSQMFGETFAVRLSPGDFTRFGGQLDEEIARRAGRSRLNLTISEEPALTGGGVIVRDIEGRQVWDNRFGPKLDRLWPELRRQIAVQAGLVVAGEATGGVS